MQRLPEECFDQVISQRREMVIGGGRCCGVGMKECCVGEFYSTICTHNLLYEDPPEMKVGKIVFFFAGSYLVGHNEWSV